jgi:hypothetical protein
MTDLGVRLRLDAGDFVSGAGRARDAVAALSAAMERLRPRVEGFERDIQSVTETPVFRHGGRTARSLK